MTARERRLGRSSSEQRASRLLAAIAPQPAIQRQRSAARWYAASAPSAVLIFVSLAASLFLSVGCGGDNPKAPAMHDGPVYQNKSAGFRFLVPQGWNQSASAQLPPKLDREFLVVQYRLKTSQQGGLFEVLCFEPQASFDLAQYHRGPSHGVEQWTDDGAPRSEQIGGEEVVRQRVKGTQGKRALVKEVASVTRGARVYSFTGVFSDGDRDAEEEINRAVTSLIWSRK